MDGNGSKRGPIATLLLGVTIGVLVTVIGQGLLDRIRVEGRITVLETQMDAMQLSIAKIDEIKMKVDYLYAFSQGQIEQEKSSGKPTRQ